VGAVRDGRADSGGPDQDGRGRQRPRTTWRAEHGFSALVELRADGRLRRVLFDAGVSTDGLIGNLDRLAISPDTFEAVVLSHGHFDHIMGLDGLARRLGRADLPLLLHPEFWTRRRIVLPGGGRGSCRCPAGSRSRAAASRSWKTGSRRSAGTGGRW
jgi:glyoxylase-like metal-dependent hydrolase (beta-lactamase superfamily II)